MRFALAKVAAMEREQSGYVAALRAAGKEVRGGWLFVPDEKLRVVWEKYYPERVNEILAPLPQPLPSVATMGVSLVRAIGRAATAAVRQERVLASQERVSERAAICAECPQLREDGRCQLCGCSVMKLLSKLRLETERCPDGRW